MISSQRKGRMRGLSLCLLIATSLYAQLYAQQAASTAPTQEISTTDDIAALKKQMVEQQRQLEQLRAALQKQQELIDKASKQAEEASARRVVPAASLGEVASTTPILPMPVVASPVFNPGQTVNAGQLSQPGPRNESPLGFSIGGTTFTPLGFVDFISITHSTDAGGGIGTSFGGLPLSNSTAGGLAETHFSMQNSRLGLRVDSNYLGYDVLGYVETDFLGNAPTNPFVTSNSDTLRMRLFFVDLKKEAFEFTAGQTWSLMTPNRVGIGVLPAEIFYSQDIDTNYQAGLTWARQTGVRFTYNNPNFHWALALENPEQYSGAAVTYPKNLATVATTELDNNAGGVAIPNLFPDVISKIALDGGSPGHRAHLEVTGLLSSFQTFNSLTTGPGALTHFKKVGGGGEVNFNFELSKQFRLVSNNFYSDGGGRYIGTGLAPDAIMLANGAPSLVHSASTVDGLEMQLSPKTLVYAYYGGVYIGRDKVFDQDNKTLIGFGVDNQTSANRDIQEVTFGIQNNFWKSREYGALMLAFQYSYLTRNPWSVTTVGAPTNANMNEGYVDLRYTLP